MSGPTTPEPDPARLVADLLFGIEHDEIDLPHIVLSRTVATGEVSYSGPYPDGLSALSAAEVEHAVEVDGGGDGQITFHVAALYPPLSPPADPRGDRGD
jgi:hypothetical protein